LNLDAKGQGAEYNADAEIVSGNVNVEGFRISNVRLKADVTGSGAQYNANADAASAQVSNQDITINSIRFSNAQVKGNEAIFDATGALTIAALKSGQINLSNLRR
jgi:hypothetical protein